MDLYESITINECTIGSMVAL